MPETRKKNVNRNNPSQTKKRTRKKGTRNTKKAKKSSPPEIMRALLITAVLIVISVIISLAIPAVRMHKVQPIDVASSVSASPAGLSEATVPQTAATEKPPVHEAPPVREVVVTPKLAAPPELPPKPQRRGTLIFIIDDAGNNLYELEPFLRFPGPLTIAVLPGLPHSAEAARRIRAAGKEVFLHQPMEAIGGQAPGPGAIHAGMTAAGILAVLGQNLAEIGPVAGINNHQGSKITADQQAMETVLAFCREQGICFVDSRTTAQTAVPIAARNLGMTIGERSIFIDNEQDRVSMNRSIENGLARASENGNAVMIGHTWSPKLAPLLAERYQDLTAQGYTFATASDLVLSLERSPVHGNIVGKR